MAQLLYPTFFILNGWWQLMKYKNFPLLKTWIHFFAGWIYLFIAHDICEGNNVVMVTSFITVGLASKI